MINICLCSYQGISEVRFIIVWRDRPRKWVREVVGNIYASATEEITWIRFRDSNQWYNFHLLSLRFMTSSFVSHSSANSETSYICVGNLQFNSLSLRSNMCTYFILKLAISIWTEFKKYMFEALDVWVFISNLFPYSPSYVLRFVKPVRSTYL